MPACTHCDGRGFVPNPNGKDSQIPCSRCQGSTAEPGFPKDYFCYKYENSQTVAANKLAAKETAASHIREFFAKPDYWTAH